MSASSSPEYTVTGIQLQVTAAPLNVDAVRKAVPMPAVLVRPISRTRLRKLFESLQPIARRATNRLRMFETKIQAGKYPGQPAEARVKIVVLSGSRTLGHIDGAGRVYNSRGQLIMGGDADERPGNS